MNIVAERDHGAIMWARMSKTSPLWAALIISTQKLNLKYKERPGKTWVYWLYEDTISHLRNSNIFEFSDKFIINTKKAFGKRRKGILAALQILCFRFNLVMPENIVDTDSIFAWAETHVLINIENQIGQSGRTEELYIPWIILKILSYHAVENIDPSKNALNLIQRKHLSTYCLCCRKPIVKKKYKHPLFNGFVGEECYINMMKQVIMMQYKNNNNKVNVVCCICFNSHPKKKLISCTKCVKKYCHHCLIACCGKKKFNVILRAQKWLCYCCSSGKNLVPCVLVHKSTAEKLDNIYKLFSPAKTPYKFASDTISKIRILAIKDDQNLVTKVFKDLDHSFELFNSDDYVNNLTNDNVNNCNDVNLLLQFYPNFEDYNLMQFLKTGTMKEFFNFIYVKDKIEAKYRSNGNTLYWAFETSCTINYSDRETISRFCKMDPVLITMGVKDIKQRGRFIWTNITMLENNVNLYRKFNFLNEKISNKSELNDPGVPWCYQSMHLILSCLLQYHVKLD